MRQHRALIFINFIQKMQLTLRHRTKLKRLPLNLRATFTLESAPMRIIRTNTDNMVAALWNGFSRTGFRFLQSRLRLLLSGIVGVAAWGLGRLSRRYGIRLKAFVRYSGGGGRCCQWVGFCSSTHCPSIHQSFACGEK